MLKLYTQSTGDQLISVNIHTFEMIQYLFA